MAVLITISSLLEVKEARGFHSSHIIEERTTKSLFSKIYIQKYTSFI